MLSVFLVGAWRFYALFMGCIVASGGAFVAALFLRLPEGRAVPGKRPGRRRAKLSDFFDVTVLPVAAVVVVSAMLVGFGFGMLMPTMQVIAVNLVPPARINTAVATVYVMLDAGTGLAPLALGFLIVATGYSGMYLILAVVLVCALLLYVLVHGRHSGRRC
jgi:MFS family permease